MTNKINRTPVGNEGLGGKISWGTAKKMLAKVKTPAESMRVLLNVALNKKELEKALKNRKRKSTS